MSAAFATLLHEWAIPRMGVCRMLVQILKGNQGSVRVFEKAGFTLRETLDDYMEVKGTWHGVHVLEWKLEE
jgi:RimJ/RimL family protein N-acetyltransferase